MDRTILLSYPPFSKEGIFKGWWWWWRLVSTEPAEGQEKTFSGGSPALHLLTDGNQFMYRGKEGGTKASEHKEMDIPH